MDKLQRLDHDPDIKIQVEQRIGIWPSATSGQRAAAAVIDFLLMGACVSLLSVLADRLFNLKLQGAEFFLSTVYFIVTQAYVGQTLGKKILGIKLVSQNEDIDEKPPRLSRLIFRETLGKFLSGILFGYGYLRIVFNSEHLALHDTLSRTRVININAMGAHAIRLRTIVAGLVVTVLVLGAGFFALNFFTTYPLKKYARLFEAAGYQIDGITGSLYRGFRIERIAHKAGDQEIELIGATFKYDAKFFSRNKEILISEISIEKAKVVLSSFSGLGLNSGKVRQKSVKERAPIAPGVGGKPKAQINPLRLKILAIDLNDVEIQLPDQPKFNLRRFVLSDLSLDSEKQSLKLGRLYIDSDAIFANAAQITFLGGQSGQLKLLEPLHLVLKPALLPKIIKSPVDLKIEGGFDNNKFNLQASGFQSRLKVSARDSLLDFRVENLTVLHFFHTDFPLWNLNLAASLNLKQWSTFKATGSVGLRHLKFDLEGATFAHQRAGRKYMLIPNMMTVAKGLGVSNTEKFFHLTNDVRSSPLEALSELYFGTEFHRLPEAHQNLVSGDAKYFGDAQTIRGAASIRPESKNSQ